MKTTKHDNSINEILMAMDIHEKDRNLPSKKTLRELRVFVVKKGSRR